MPAASIAAVILGTTGTNASVALPRNASQSVAPSRTAAGHHGWSSISNSGSRRMAATMGSDGARVESVGVE